MKKFIKISLLIFSIIFISFNPIIRYVNAQPTATPSPAPAPAPAPNQAQTPPPLSLVKEADNVLVLPKRFRRSTDEINTSQNPNLNLNGLDKLNISGSAQFSENELLVVKQALGNKMPTYIIDLREESHGFINGIAVSWKNAHNNANKGLSFLEIIDAENKLLNSVQLNKPLQFSNSKEQIVPERVQNELNLTKAHSLFYDRIPVTDGELPSPERVNYFVGFVKNLPKDTWVHFHCKEGIGRTTTFMIMYDIMRNCNNVSLNDIINRQVLLAGLNEKETLSFTTGKRYEFLNKFYIDYNASACTFSIAS